MTKNISKSLLLSAGVVCLTGNFVQAEDWKTKTISPVANPLFFEDPQINSEVRPVFAYHEISDDFVDGFARYYALQLRYAITDRLAVIATKDGYIQLRIPGLREDGWADIGAGLKYALIDDKENQFILTPGFKIELPTGNRDVFQGNGKGEWDVFVSAGKGFDNFHILANAGVRLPNDWDEETASMHYSLHFDYYVHQYFIPFIAASGHTVLSEAERTPFDVEGFDLINFGAAEAKGRTQVVFAGGFRSRLIEDVDVGVSYETSLTRPEGLFENRITADLIWRF